MKLLSKAVFAVASILAAASFSFAGPGMADGGAKFLGNITTGNQVRSDFGQYWNQITAENECKWGSINKAENQYNWSGCDRAYNWAKQNGGHFKFHALIWGAQYPSWISSLSAERTKEVIEKWMKAVADHYNPMGGIEMIDVVNEAIRTGENKYHSGYMGTKIIQALGGDNGKYTFVAEAFKMARKYFPNSVLIYNDYNTIQWHIDQGIDLIKQIKAQGAPVDAFGLQSHDVTNLGKSQFESALKKIHDAVQIPLIISEYDIEQIDDQKQKNDYANQIPFLWETEWVAGITLWGYIYGQTWLNCNGQANGCSGLIRNGQDRPAMTWLKQYFKENLAKGKNTTGIGGGEPVEPEPRQLFKGNAFDIPGKIEMEDFDIAGKGINEDGTSNETFNETDSENKGDSDYRTRDAPGVDLYKKATGVVVGYNNAGEWLEYSVNVAEDGDYTLFAAVSSEGGSAMNFTLDGKDLTGDIDVPSVGNYTDYVKVSKNVTLSAGKHILRFNAVKDWFDIDYVTFVKGKDAADPEPIAKEGEVAGGDEPETPPMAIQTSVKYGAETLQDYLVIDMNGHYMGVMSAYGFDAARDILNTSSAVKSSGLYILRNRYTGEMQRVRVVR